jgi:hypothetical protein
MSSVVVRGKGKGKMEPGVSSLEAGSGRVTAGGIRFAGHYYACSYALKAGWYELSSQEEEWDVNVYYHPAPEPQDTIYIEVSDTLTLCRRLDSLPQEGDSTLRYREALRQLKEERIKKMRKRNGDS